MSLCDKKIDYLREKIIYFYLIVLRVSVCNTLTYLYVYYLCLSIIINN